MEAEAMCEAPAPHGLLPFMFRFQLIPVNSPYCPVSAVMLYWLAWDLVCSVMWCCALSRATRHGSGQECATWVSSTIELGSLRVVNGTGVTPLHPPCWVMTTTQRYSCQVLLTTTVNTHTLGGHSCTCEHWDTWRHRPECVKSVKKRTSCTHTYPSCLSPSLWKRACTYISM